MKTIQSLNKKITKCKKCPRLSIYIRDVAKNKVRRFKEEKYYGKPLSGFGDVNAKLLIVGLAPAAHGGNRTGRMFTGDSSGDWVAKVMHKHDATCKLYNVKSEKFGHSKLFVYDNFKILTSYHPSKQNTQTGRLTWNQWSAVFGKAKKLIK